MKELPPAINLDGTLREKLDGFDYGLTIKDAEIEYYQRLNEFKRILNEVSIYKNS